jgi:RNA polymerase sigma-70 factor (ECF subfamily)
MTDIDAPQPEIATDDPALDTADVTLSRRGDGEAYERIIRRHQQELSRRLRRFARDRRTLEELVHETFVQAYLSLDRFRGDAPFSHWLHRIAVRTGYRYWKEMRREARAQALVGEPAVTVNEAADSETLHQVLQQLSPRDRLVVTMLYLEEHTVAETADLIGWSQTMVKVQAFRARGRLRKLMEARNSAEDR